MLFSDNLWAPDVRCWNECKPGYAGWKFGQYTTCVCDEGTCAFDNKKIALCVVAACDTDIESLAYDFGRGFDSLDIDGFTPDTSHFKAVEVRFSNLL